MFVTLIGGGIISKVKLPQTVNGNYWLTEKKSGKKIINIEGKNGKWQITSNDYIKIVNPKYIKINDAQIQILKAKDRILNKIALQEHNMYGVLLGDNNEFFILYCSPIFEKNLCHFKIKSAKEILIGNGTDNQILYKNVLVSKNHARIFINDGKWIIQNLDAKFGTFVNDKPVPKEGMTLSNGDVIFIMGLKIIIIGNDFYINNPLNNISYDAQAFYITSTNVEITTSKIKENDDSELYSEKDYFFRSPRITNKIERETIRIDAPPQMQEKEEMPLILTLGTSLTMGLMMLVSMLSAISSTVSGNGSFKDTMISVIISILMLIGIIAFPILTVKYEKRRKIRYEKKRQTRYRNYVNSKVDVIEKIMNKQRNILLKNYVSLDECIDIIINKKSRLWERKIEDYDFLTVRLGIGDTRLNIDIQYPEERI